MATVPEATTPRPSLPRGQLGLFGVIMPGVAQVAPAFNLFFTTGLIVSLAGASAALWPISGSRRLETVDPRAS